MGRRLDCPRRHGGASSALIIRHNWSLKYAILDWGRSQNYVKHYEVELEA